MLVIKDANEIKKIFFNKLALGNLILQLLKTEVLNNKNLNVNLDIYGDKFKNLLNIIAKNQIITQLKNF